MGCDLELEITSGGASGVYAVTVDSPAGAAAGTVQLDIAGLLGRRRELAASVLASAVVTRAGVSVLERPVREVGQALFAGVFADRIYGRYTASVQEAARRGEPLRVVLRLRAPELAGLPWETLFDPEAGEYLCQREPVVRYVETAQPATPLAVDPPLRILGLVAAPRDLPALDVAEERRRLTDAVVELAGRRWVELVWAPGGSWPVLQQLLLAGPWHVLHFVGHGGTDPAGGGGLLALEDEASGQAAWVSAARFARLLHTSRPVPRLVVLNSCQSGEAAADDLLSSTAAALVHSGISAAVAMQFAVTDPAALAFARGFYQALARNTPVDEAVRIGRIAIDGTGEQTLEWVTPVLYLRTDDTRLFTVQAVSGTGVMLPEQPSGEDVAREAALVYQRDHTGENAGDWDSAVREDTAILREAPNYRGVRLAELDSAADSGGLTTQTSQRIKQQEETQQRPAAADARHFDGERPPAPPTPKPRRELTLNLEQLPAEAKPGKQVTWQLMVENTGGCLLREVIARRNDDKTLADPVELAPGRRHTISWSEPFEPGLRDLITVTALDPQGSSILEQVERVATGRKANYFLGRQKWAVLGGGRIGLGFLSPIAQELGFRPLLFVAGEETSQDIVDRFNEASEKGKGHRIQYGETSKPLQIRDYEFKVSVNTGPVIDAIADPQTVVLSTSVGFDRLPQIAPIVAQGLKHRALINSTANTNRLLILVCENGRSPEGLSAAEWFKRKLKNLIGSEQVTELVEVPHITIDAMVPERGDPDAVTWVSPGKLWVEGTKLTQRLTESSSVRIVSESDIALIHTRKLYCFNTLHCLLSVFGQSSGKEFVGQVAKDRSLRPALGKIVNALVSAACQRHGVLATDIVAGESTEDYGRRALERLQSPAANRDRVSRALDGLGKGRYLHDGRIDGPLIDAGLITEPSQAKELVHAVSLCMYFVVSRINQIRHRFLWLARNGLDSDVDNSCIGIAHIPIFDATSCFGENNTDSQLMEVMARDFAELDRTMMSGWSISHVVKYLDRSIAKPLPVLPRKLSHLGLVVFDLDEGLVGTESLLYEVTRDLISERSDLHSTISLDFYARHVGMSEIDFFFQMVRRYRIGRSTRKTPAELVKEQAAELVSEREKRYRIRLDAADRDSLLKPGFRYTLELLARRGVKIAICSNASNVRVEATLERVGIAPFFSACATPDQGMEAKPSPEMLLSLQRQVDVQPRDCLVVESSLSGVFSSIDAGCFTILLVNDYTAPDLVPRRGVEILPNSQALAKWFDAFFEGRPWIPMTPVR